MRLDGPAGTLPVDTSIAATHEHYSSVSHANTGGYFEASVRAGELLERTREVLARLLGARSEEVVIGRSSTSLAFEFTRALSRHWEPGDLIVCTRLDHDANVAPWLRAAHERGASVAFLDVDPVTGVLDIEPLGRLCRRRRTRWVAVPGASNLTGHAPDLAEVARVAHAHGARVHVDAVARVPHLSTDVTALDVDSLMTSPYKWYGPHAGVLIVRSGLLGSVAPYRVRPADDTGPPRWELGTPQFEVVAGIEGAARFMLEADIAAVAAAETGLLVAMQHGLEQLDGVTVHGPPPSGERAPTVIFSLAGRHPDEVARYLAAQRIAVWSGDNYACELIDALGLRAGGGAVRASVVRYSTDADIAALLVAVADLGPG